MALVLRYLLAVF